MRKIIVLVLVICCALRLPAQQSVIDSLQKILKERIPDTVRANVLLRIAQQYETVDTVQAYKAYQQAIDFALTTKQYWYVGLSYQNKSFLYTNSTRYARALEILDSAIQYLDKAPHTPPCLYTRAQTIAQKGNVFHYMGDEKKGIEYQLEAARAYEQLGKTTSLIRSYVAIGFFYRGLQDKEKFEAYLLRAIEAANKYGRNKDDMFYAYSTMAQTLADEADGKRAMRYIDTANLYYSNTTPPFSLITHHLIAGYVYTKQRMYDLAKKHFEQSYELARKNNSVYSMLQSKLQLGRILAYQKRHKEGIAVLLNTYEEMKKTKEPDQLLTAQEYLSDTYKEAGNYEKALYWYTEYKRTADTMSSEKNRKYIAEVEVKFETEKKKEQISKLEAEQQLQALDMQKKSILNYVLIATAVGLVVISLLLIGNYRQKQKIQQQRIVELETEKKLTAVEAVLKGEEQERTRLAKDLHDGLGGILSGIKFSLNSVKGNLIMTPENSQAFERSLEMLDTSISEMRRVAHNMMPEALLNLGLDMALQDFCYGINDSGALQLHYESIGLEGASVDQTTSITIYRIVQELINNTMKHAAAQSAFVQVTKRGEQMTITVEDDGKGFDTAMLRSKKGMGWGNIRNRVEFLKGTIDVRSKQGKGTSVMIEFNT